MNQTHERSFDSGYFSPAHAQIKVEPLSPSLPMLSSDLTSPMKMSTNSMQGVSLDELSEKPYDDVSISSEWEKEFFTNFEENLFNFDFDDKALSDILVSPKGKEALNDLMRSPKGKAIMNSPKGKILQNKLKSLDTPENVKFKRTNSSGFDTSPKVLSPCDPNKMSATPGPYRIDSRNALKMSRRKLSMLISGKEDQEPFQQNVVQTVPAKEIKMVSKPVAIAPKPLETSDWPTKEKLKFARDQFKRTLDKAIEATIMQQKVIQEVTAPLPKKRKKIASKSEHFPELKHALSRPAPQKISRRSRFPSIKLRESKETEIEIKKELCTPASPFFPDYEEEIDYDDDEDEDYDDFYKNYVPFTGLKQAKRRKKMKAF